MKTEQEIRDRLDQASEELQNVREWHDQLLKDTVKTKSILVRLILVKLTNLEMIYLELVKQYRF